MPKTSAVVSDVWIKTDRWPDAKSLASWVKDIFRLENARTQHDQALALWKWTHICVTRSWPAVLEGPRGHEGYCMDTLKYLAVHSGHYCDGISRVMVNAWQTLGRQARKMVICRLGHTVADLQYKDADGVTRWHVFDPQHGWYVLSRDGSRVASVDEINADTELQMNPVNPPRPHFFSPVSKQKYLNRERTTLNPCFGESPAPQHRMVVNLRRGEIWRRAWEKGPTYWPISMSAIPPLPPAFAASDTLGSLDGVFINEYVRPYLYDFPADIEDSAKKGAQYRASGVCELRYRVPLVGGQFVCGADRVSGMVGEKRRSADKALMHPAKLHEVGTAVFEIKTPYIITDARVEGIARRGTQELDMLSIVVSSDGGSSYTDVWGSHWAQESRQIVKPEPFSASFGQDAYREDKLSVVGRYGYHVRVDALARNAVGEVGFDELTIVTTCQCNMMALPAFQPGDNVVTVKAKAQDKTAKLAVTYTWTEKSGGDRRLRKILPAGGGSFNVRVGGQGPQDVRMREVTIEVV